MWLFPTVKCRFSFSFVILPGLLSTKFELWTILETGFNDGLLFTHKGTCKPSDFID